MKTTARSTLMELKNELYSNSSITIEEITINLPLNKKEKATTKNITPQDIFYLHNEVNGLAIRWNGTEVDDLDIKGSVNILSLKDIFRDWNNVVFFDFTPANARIRNFHPIDFFIDEACVGVFLNEKDSEDVSLYLYNFEGDPQHLHLDMKGYIQMMNASKGFLYWQDAIIEVITGTETGASQRFKVWMPRLFPGFDWNQYVDLYASLKLPCLPSDQD